MTYAAGVDIGSTASKAVILIDGKPAGVVIGPSSTNPKRTAHQIYDKALAAAGIKAGEVQYIVGRDTAGPRWNSRTRTFPKSPVMAGEPTICCRMSAR